jgi:hypothetical protein
MTVSTTEGRKQYDGDDSETEFVVPFEFTSEDDLKVLKQNTSTLVETALTLGVDYTIVTGVGGDAWIEPPPPTFPTNVKVVCTVAPSSSERLTLYRDPDGAQTLDLISVTSLPPKTLQPLLNKITTIADRAKSLASRAPSKYEGDDDEADPGRYNFGGHRGTNADDAVDTQDLATLATVLAEIAKASVTPYEYPITANAAVLISRSTFDDMLDTLGGEALGIAIFKDATAGDALVTLGGGAEGINVFQAATAGAILTGLGLSSQGVSLVNDQTEPEAQATLAIPSKNLIDNSNFDIWQKEVSFTSPASGDMLADRWAVRYVGDEIAVDVTQEADVPADASAGPSTYSLKIEITTEEDAVAAGDYFILEQRINGTSCGFLRWNAGVVYHRDAYLSFWVKSSETGTYYVSVRNSAEDRSFIGSYTVDQANTWEFKTIAVDAPDTGTWIIVDGIGIKVGFCLGAGTDWHGSVAWQSANKLSTVSQEQWFTAAGATFQVSAINFHEGKWERPYVPPEFHEELDHLELYYQKSLAYGTHFDGANTELGNIELVRGNAHDPVAVQFRRRMRATPTSVDVYSASTGAVDHIHDESTAADRDAGTQSLCDSGFVVNPTEATTAGDCFRFHYEADANL